jgi:hypothetical protein
MSNRFPYRHYIVAQLEVHPMNSIRTIAGSGLVLVLTFSTPVAWGQSLPKTIAAPGSAGSARESASLMDHNVSREIKQAWSEGKNTTLAMSFQENGEVAMSEGKEMEARQYFQAAEQELGTLQPEQRSYTSY